jgi:hypothetical protein
MMDNFAPTGMPRPNQVFLDHHDKQLQLQRRVWGQAQGEDHEGG